MPKVNFVKKARKDNPAVKAGESYYWWQFAFSPVSYSKEKPQRWQLTKSEFLQTIWQMEDGIGPTMTTEDVDNLISELESMRDEQQEKLDNIPEQLQESSALNERIELLDDFIDELVGISNEFDGADESTGFDPDNQPIEEQIADRVKDCWPSF